MKTITKTPPTLEPVTVSGFYERTDGSIGQYVWAKGNVVECRSFPSWVEVGETLRNERAIALGEWQ